MLFGANVEANSVLVYSTFAFVCVCVCVDVKFSTMLDTLLIIFERKMSKRSCFHGKLRENMNSASGNRPFRRYIVPLFQNESSNIFSYEWFHTKIRFDTGKRQLGSGQLKLGTWTLRMGSSPPSSLACSRCGSLERISCIACECDRTSYVVIGRRLCAINWCPKRLTVGRYKR